MHYTICGMASNIKKKGTFSHFSHSGWCRTPYAMFEEGGGARIWEIDKIKNTRGRVVYRSED